MQTQWRREGFCRPGQRSVVPPFQPATSILSALNKLKINIELSYTLTHCNANAKIPNFRPSNAAPCEVPPGSAALPRPILTATVKPYRNITFIS